MIVMEEETLLKERIRKMQEELAELTAIRDAMWSDATWSDAMWSDAIWSDVLWSDFLDLFQF